MNDVIFDEWFDNTFGDGFIDQSPRAIAGQAWETASRHAPVDAQRYRFLRRFDHWASVDAFLETHDHNTLDSAVDAAMARDPE